MYRDMAESRLEDFRAFLKQCHNFSDETIRTFMFFVFCSELMDRLSKIEGDLAKIASELYEMNERDA